MKKGRRVLSLLLALVLISGLCACGKKGEEGSANNEKSIATDPSLAKQYVFRPQDLNLGIDFDSVNLASMRVIDNRVYMLIEDWSGKLRGETAGKEGAPDTSVMGVEGDVAVNDVLLPVVEEDNGTYYVMLSVNTDGTDMKMQEMKVDNSQNGWISNWKILNDGSVLAMKEIWPEYDDENYDNMYENVVYHCIKWDINGNILWQEPISSEEGEYVYIRSAFLKNNNIIMVAGNRIITLNNEGEQVKTIELDNSEQFDGGYFYEKNDGSVIQILYNNDYTKIYIMDFDLETGEFGEKIELPIKPMEYQVTGIKGSDLLVTDQTGIYTYKVGDAEPVKVVDFVNSDLPVYMLENINFINDKEFIATYHDFEDYKLELSKFVYVAPENIPDKITLLLACDYMNETIKRDVILFNKSSDKYRITMKSYNVYGQGEENAIPEGLTKMNNDLISGNIPDILVFSTNPDVSIWANKGILADIGELIANDPELSQLEYIENVFKAMSINDKLYTFTPYFGIDTMVARKDVVGDRTGWTMSEMMQFMKTQSADVKPYDGDYSREIMLSYIMRYCGDDFIDANTGKCNFDSPEFVEILEFAKTLPEKIEYDEEYWNNYDWMAIQDMYRNKKAIMMSCSIYDMKDLVSQFHGRLGDEPVFVGFPGVSGNSSVIFPVSSVFAVSAKSENQEGAWQFVRKYLTEEHQTDDEYYGLPVLKSAFEAKAKLATQKPFWIDYETGEKIEHEYTYWSNEEEIILEPFTQKEVDDICSFVYSVDKAAYDNPYITNIVKEEAAAFFSGQKSAKEVVQVIQSRAQVYVDENM